MCISNSPYSNEDHIVWLDDPGKYPYLRESMVLRPSRDRFSPRSCHGWHVVGYAVLAAATKRNSPGEYFQRRVWWRRDSDDDTDVLPCEAVDPSSIMAGWPSSPMREAQQVTIR